MNLTSRRVEAIWDIGRLQGSTGANAERGTAEASVAGFSSIQSMIATIRQAKTRGSVGISDRSIARAIGQTIRGVKVNLTFLRARVVPRVATADRVAVHIAKSVIIGSIIADLSAIVVNGTITTEFEGAIKATISRNVVTIVALLCVLSNAIATIRVRIAEVIDGAVDLNAIENTRGKGGDSEVRVRRKERVGNDNAEGASEGLILVNARSAENRSARWARDRCIIRNASKGIQCSR